MHRHRWTVPTVTTAPDSSVRVPTMVEHSKCCFGNMHPMTVTHSKLLRIFLRILANAWIHLPYALKLDLATMNCTFLQRSSNCCHLTMAYQRPLSNFLPTKRRKSPSWTVVTNSRRREKGEKIHYRKFVRNLLRKKRKKSTNWRKTFLSHLISALAHIPWSCRMSFEPAIAKVLVV